MMAVLALCALVGTAAAADNLAKNFVTPPKEARIWVYWFWLNGNLTREGMTAALEARTRAGVGGVLIMEVDQGAPVGPVAFMSDKWRELFKHMVSEAHRLGLEVNMNNDAGWNGSGGPWVPLDKAMQVVVTSEKQVPGGSASKGNCPNLYPEMASIAISPCWPFQPQGIRRISPIVSRTCMARECPGAECMAAVSRRLLFPAFLRNPLSPGKGLSI